VFLVVCASFVLYTSVLSLREALASRQWPSVPGQIDSARTVFITGRHNSSAPRVRYSYAVAGRRFQGKRLEVVSYASNTSYASDALAEFREGAAVPVYYDPTRPERSVLRRGPNWLAYSLPLISLGLGVFAIALLRLARRYGVGRSS
jgi:hypothetical protein